jgi:hypothetical protein
MYKYLGDNYKKLKNIYKFIIKKHGRYIMKKIGIYIIISLLIITATLSPVIAYENEEDQLSEQSLNLRVLLAFGLINMNSLNKEIKGFVIVGYNAGETITFQPIDIKYEGFPLVITKSLFYIFCIYKEAEII